MENFENWIEKMKGVYRYVIAAGACYIIFVEKHVHGTTIEQATANLYLEGEWYSGEESYFGRELLFTGTVKDCVRKAVADDEEYNKHLREV